MSTSWKILGALGLIALIVFYCLYGMSTANASMRPCPGCGKETSSTLIAEQGCCNDCYDKAEQNNRYYTSNKRNSGNDADQYDYYFRDAEEQQRRDDYYERQQEEKYERMHEEGY